MQESICEISIEDIRVSPFQPRRYFSEEELEELAESIRSVGLIHPPVVRRIESGGRVHYYELIAGERRWRAAKKAGLEKLNVIVKSSSDEWAAKSTLIENVQRVNLNPIETARAFKKLIEVFRMTQEEVSEKVGKKRSTVANYLRLLSLPDTIQEVLQSGKISMGHAKAILSLNSLELQKKLTDLIVEKDLTVRDSERESKKLTRKKRETSRKSDVHIENLQNQLQEHFKTKIDIMHTDKKGKLTIHYFGIDDLQRVLEILSLKLQ